MMMRVLGAGWQFCLIQARKIEQRAINVSLRGLDTLASAARVLPPGRQCRLALGRAAVGFIRHNDICRGELVAEVLIAQRFFIEQLARVEQAERGAQIDPGFINRCGQ